MRTVSILVIASILIIGQACNQNQKSDNQNSDKVKTIEKTEHYTFQLSDKVTRQKVTFKNRYGITLAGADGTQSISLQWLGNENSGKLHGYCRYKK